MLNLNMVSIKIHVRVEKIREIYTIVCNIDDLWDKKSLIWTLVIIINLLSQSLCKFFDKAGKYSQN